MRMRGGLVLLSALLATPLWAQNRSASDVMSSAVRAYRDLEFDTAATLLRRVLAPPLDRDLDNVQRARALTYLGAAEHYRGQPDSAIVVFRRLVAVAPGQQPDTLTFPPEITRLYDAVRNSMATVAVRAPVDTVPAITTTPTPTPTPTPPVAPDTVRQLLATPERSRGARFTATGAGLLSIVRTGSDGGGAYGFTGSVRLGRVALDVRYAQGTLQPADRQSTARDIVEGSVALRFAATSWLSLQLGPHARRYDTPSGAERWVTWQLGTRGDFVIAGPGVRGHALLWRGTGLDVNVPPGSGSARGGEVGFTIDGPRSFWLDLSYGIDQARVRDVARRETVEAVTVTVGVRRR
jgi:hypothetical protein